MNLQQAPVVFAMLSSLVPLCASWARRQSRLLAIATVLVSGAVLFHLFVLLRILGRLPAEVPTSWVLTLMATPVPVLLSGYLLAVSFGRQKPEETLRRSPRTFLYLGMFGIAFLVLLRHPSFVTQVQWQGGVGTIALGSVGKAYLSYLLVGIVVIGFNLESTYRFIPSHLRHRLRLTFLGLLGILGYYTFLLTTGILYSAIGTGKVVAAGIPLGIAAGMLGFGILRGALDDLAVPISRNVVYSSFTAMAAGLYVFAVGVLSQIATFAKWSPDEIVTLSFGFLAVLVAVLFLFSNRFQRQVRRFIDRNFYVNRYDYRAQWSNLNRALASGSTRDDLVRCAHSVLGEIFLADHVSIATRMPASQAISPILGKGVGDSRAVLHPGTPLYEKLREGRRSLLFDRRPDDFEYIAIYAENDAWFECTATQMIAPLLDNGELTGAIGLERSHPDDAFTYEDLDLLDSVAIHLSSALRSARLAEELAESREMELVSQWSHMLLHDLKNYLTPLRLVAQNLTAHGQRPEVTAMASRDIENVVTRMQTLVQKLSELRSNLRMETHDLDLSELVRTAFQDVCASRPQLEAQLDLQARARVQGDESMLRRVIENLLVNALEAMNGNGALRVQTWDEYASGSRSTSVGLAIADGGCGIPEDFLRHRLFRPFATTKKTGLGLGLYQSHAIVRAHGGSFDIESSPGNGTTVRILFPATPPSSPGEQTLQPEREPDGVVP